MPGHQRIDAGDELGHPLQIIRIVAEIGDHQRDDLDPEAALLEHFDGAGDVLENAAELAIIFVGESFQIDFVGIDVGTDEVEDLGRAVAVGDVGAAQAAGFGDFEDIDGPFAGDQRLVVA